MKIARPSRPEAAFKRKRRPPPQATKLLRYSLLAGVVFMVLLAIVFLPRMFPEQSPVEIVNPANGGRLRLETPNSTGARLWVDATTNTLPLTKFRANFTRDGVVIGNLDVGLVGGTSTLSFVDANAPGLLDAGDYFAVATATPGCYRFELWQVDVGRLSGFIEWGGCPAT